MQAIAEPDHSLGSGPVKARYRTDERAEATTIVKCADNIWRNEDEAEIFHDTLRRNGWKPLRD